MARFFSIVFKIWLGIIIGIAVFILIAVIIGSFSDTTERAEVDVIELRSIALNIPYDRLARYPDLYQGDPVIYEGRVVQKVSDRGLRVNITPGSYNTWRDNIYVVLRDKARETRVLEGDIVELLGYADGERTYRSIFRQRITIPQVEVYELKVLR